MSTLTATIQRHADGSLHVFLAGTMDEDSDFEGIFARLDSDAVINLEAVRRINSIGVHRWIRAISSFAEKRRAQIEACSYPVALQANCVANLFGSASVHSSLAPYYCPGCKRNRMVLVSAQEFFRGGNIPPVKQCPSCDAVMVFDELENYFRFFNGGAL